MGLVLLLCGCKEEKHEVKTEANPETISNAATEIAALNTQLKNHEVPSQFFKVASDKKHTVKSKLGTNIYIDPSDLETSDGTAIGTIIQVELKELINQQHFLRSSTQTVSNGKLLVSGGAYFINLTSENKQLKLKDGKNLTVDFPKFSKEEMSLFYGEKDSLGLMNWELAESRFISPKKTEVASNSKFDSINYEELDNIIAYTDKPLTKAERKKQRQLRKNENLENKIYNSIKLKKLGWINCDRFLEIENKTDLEYVINNANEITASNIYLIFKDINSLMQNTYYSGDGNSESQFTTIPEGSNVELIAVSIKEDKKYSFRTTLKIKKGEKVNIVLKETNDKDFEQLFQ